MNIVKCIKNLFKKVELVPEESVIKPYYEPLAREDMWRGLHGGYALPRGAILGKEPTEETIFIDMQRMIDKSKSQEKGRAAFYARFVKWQRKHQKVGDERPIIPSARPLRRRRSIRASVFAQGGYENIVKNILIQAERPLDIKSVIRKMGPKYRSKKNSVRAGLNRFVRTNRTFTRNKSHMFGLLEWVKEEKGG